MLHVRNMDPSKGVVILVVERQHNNVSIWWLSQGCKDGLRLGQGGYQGIRSQMKLKWKLWWP